VEATHRQMAMVRIPVTVYKEDPEKTATPAEWQEVWVGHNPKSGEWVLCKRHGWWEDANKQPHFDVPILSEPYRTEAAANAAMDAEIQSLHQQGWTHKFTTVINYRTGSRAPQRLP
jgi:hypothetical protein